MEINRIWLVARCTVLEAQGRMPREAVEQACREWQEQELLAQEYQRQHNPPRHTHRCVACGAELVCSCADRRLKDRHTGRERKFYCFGCTILYEAARQGLLNEEAS